MNRKKIFLGKIVLIASFLGLNLNKILSLRYFNKFINDILTFKRAGGHISHYYPLLENYKEQAGSTKGHYFHQDLLVATNIQRAKPIRHIDIGSRIDGFVAHVASFRNIEVFDIRPLQNTGHEQIKFIQGDLMLLNDSLTEICDSLSCLHALEHFGLGRYGDPIDPLGHLKGFKNLHKMLKTHGILYISFPIGNKSKVYFNAHRVFHPAEILEWSKGLFELIRFDYVDDNGELNKEKSLNPLPNLEYGCGIYTLKKI